MIDILDIINDEVVEQSVEDDKVVKLDLFKDYIRSINFSKKDMWDDYRISTYSPFVVNMMAGRDISTILYANEMNLYNKIPKKAHYKYMLASIPKGRKNMSGSAKDKTDLYNIELVMKYYNYSYVKAKQAIRILTDDQIIEIEKYLNLGGKNK